MLFSFGYISLLISSGLYGVKDNFLVNKSLEHDEDSENSTLLLLVLSSILTVSFLEELNDGFIFKVCNAK
jgi:hypothetical protein